MSIKLNTRSGPSLVTARDPRTLKNYLAKSRLQRAPSRIATLVSSTTPPGSPTRASKWVSTTPPGSPHQLRLLTLLGDDNQESGSNTGNDNADYNPFWVSEPQAPKATKLSGLASVTPAFLFTFSNGKSSTSPWDDDDDDEDCGNT